MPSVRSVEGRSRLRTPMTWARVRGSGGTLDEVIGVLNRLRPSTDDLVEGARIGRHEHEVDLIEHRAAADQDVRVAGSGSVLNQVDFMLVPPDPRTLDQ